MSSQLCDMRRRPRVDSLLLVSQIVIVSRRYLFLLLFLPPFRLADFPALEIAAARDFGMPLRLSASYLLLFLIDLPAISAPFQV